MVAVKARRIRERAARANCAGHSGVFVDDEQRRRMIECFAYFHAARFRSVRPGEYRKEDLLDAEACIDAILSKHRPR